MAATERPSSKVLIQVVGGVLVAAVLYLCRSWIPAVWHWFRGALVATWHFLLENYRIPGWLLVIFLACSLLVIVRIIATFRQSPKPREPSEDDYTEDKFFGLTWRWRYGQMGLYGLVPFCPRCDMQVHPLFDHVGTYGTRTGYHCDNCDNHVSLEGGHEHIENKVTRHIQRKLRSGEWKQVPSKNPAEPIL